MTWKSDAEVYECLGRFCVDFEHVCRSMESCIRDILHSQGLASEPIQEILLSGKTAEPLRSLLHSLIGQTLVSKREEEKLCSKMFGQLQDLVKRRNNLIHAKWYFVGMQTKEKEQEIIALGEKLHANKQGVATQNFDLKKSELEELTGQCREASIMLSLLTRCIAGIRNLEECFQIDDGQLRINYEALKPVQMNVKHIP